MSEKVQVTTKKPEPKRENRVSQMQKTDLSQSISSPLEQILFLQRTIGNQAVGRLLKSGALQAKLRIGQQGDVYEQEADRVADAVMRMLEPQAVSSNTLRIQKMCPECDKDELRREPVKEEEEEELKRKEASGQTPQVTPEVENNINSMRGGGQPLPEHVRAFYEPRFGHDFSQVRVHTDAKAAEAAKVVNARAYTVGKDVVFGAGEYQPVTGGGRRLLAHELMHVLQQSYSEPPPVQLAPPTGARHMPHRKQQLVARIDEQNAELIIFSNAITLAEAKAYLWCLPPERPEVIRPDPSEKAAEGKQKRFLVDVKNDIGLAFSMQHGLSEAYLRRLQPIRSKRPPIPPLEKQIAMEWVPESVKRQILDLHKAGEFSKELPKVYTFSGNPPYGRIVLWVGPSEFTYRETVMEMYQYYPEDIKFYQNLRGYTQHAARLHHFARTIWNKDMKFYVEGQKMRPSDARIFIQQQWAEIFRMFVGAVGMVFASAGGMARAPKAAPGTPIRKGYGVRPGATPKAPPKAIPPKAPPEAIPPRAPPKAAPPKAPPEAIPPRASPEVKPTRLEELSIDSQAGKVNPKSQSEAQTILQAEQEGLVKNARRPDLRKGEPNLDFKIDGGYADIKTPINPTKRPLLEQAKDMATKINKYDPDVTVIIDLKNLNASQKSQFKTGLVNAGAKINKVKFLND